MGIYKWGIYSVVLYCIISPFVIVGLKFSHVSDYWPGCLLLALIVFFAPGFRFMFDDRNLEEELQLSILSLILQGACLSGLLLLWALIMNSIEAVSIFAISLTVFALTASIFDHRQKRDTIHGRF